jgi:hypothetical protein
MSELRKQVLDRLTAKPVPFSFGGVSAFLKVWTAAERRSFVLDHNAREDKNELFAERLVVACLCDEGGRLVFGPDEVELVSAELDGRFVEAAGNRAHELNRLGGDDDPKAQTPSGTTPN